MKIITFQMLIALMLCLITSCAGNASEQTPQKTKSATSSANSEKHVSNDNKKGDVTVNIFIENSGSMMGYFNGQDFQMEIGSLITGLQQANDVVKDVHFYYINKSIHKGSDKSDVFIRGLVSNANVGNQSSTNIGELIEKVCDSTYVKKNSVSILISDFIISPGSKNAASVSASEINKISGVSNKLAENNYAVAFYRMLVSDFTGKYYDCDDKHKLLSKEKRPYFMMVVGDKDFIKMFQAGIAPKIINMSNNKASTNHQCYFKLDSVNVKFKFPKGVNFHVCSNPLCIHEDKYMLGKDKEGNEIKYFTFNIETSKSFPKLLSASYLTNKNNYKLSDDNAVIEKISQKNGKYNFQIKLKSSKKSKAIKGTTLTLKLIIQNPAWIEKYNINDCSEIFAEGNEEKTYGLEYVTRGMFSTFHEKREFTIAEIRINNCKK